MKRDRLLYLLVFLSGTTFQSCEEVYTIEDLFNIPGCTGPCYQKMKCEGMEVTVEQMLTGRNVLRAGRKYFVRSEEADKSISVEFAEIISDAVIEKVANNTGKTLRIRGIIEGFDLLNPDFCQRSHVIFIQDEKDISFH